MKTSAKKKANGFCVIIYLTFSLKIYLLKKITFIIITLSILIGLIKEEDSMRVDEAKINCSFDNYQHHHIDLF
jgi:hypothetical protein